MKMKIYIATDWGYVIPLTNVDGSAARPEEIKNMDLRLAKELYLLQLLILGGQNMENFSDHQDYWDPYINDFTYQVANSCAKKLEKLGYEVINTIKSEKKYNTELQKEVRINKLEKLGSETNGHDNNVLRKVLIWFALLLIWSIMLILFTKFAIILTNVLS